MISLVMLISGVYAVQTRRRTIITAILLAVVAAATSVVAFSRGIRGDPLVEGSFSLFYAFTTAAVFVEVVRTKDVTADAIFGAVCVYLLIGVTFGTLYDLIETLSPGSFRINVSVVDSHVGWRTLIFFSFMTLTTIGYGDITPDVSDAVSGFH